jgi:6,7-dimethyl-8-ribityllumazine synthase
VSDNHDERRWNEERDVADPRRDDTDLEEARENVFESWPAAVVSAPPEQGAEYDEPDEPDGYDEDAADAALDSAGRPGEPHAVEPFAAETEGAEDNSERVPVPSGEPFGGVVTSIHEPDAHSAEHAPGELTVPPGYSVLEGEPDGSRRSVGIVVGRFNGDVTNQLLESALEELDRAGVDRDAITVMPVPGAFELPLAAMALAKTRRFAAIVALGCVIRGDTPHFDYVASEAASGLQLAGLETGVPVSFGVLTLDRADQAEHRIQKGAEAVRTALEMADVFANLRAAAAR